MKDVKIYLKTGQVIDLTVASMSMTVTALDKRLTWTGVENEEKLLYVDLDHVAAITHKDRHECEEVERS